MIQASPFSSRTIAGGSPTTSKSANTLPEITDTPLALLWAGLPDVRSGFAADQAEARLRFLTWWAFAGRQAYPSLGDPLPGAVRAWLVETAGDVTQDTGFPISRLMIDAWRWRKDLQARFPLDRQDGRIAFVRWFLLEAVVEHALGAYLSDAQWAAVSAPGGGVAAGFAPLDGLLLALWETEGDLRQRFSIADPAGREQFHRWYVTEGARLTAEGKLPGDARRRARTPQPRPVPAAVAGPLGLNLIGDGTPASVEEVRSMALAAAAAGIPHAVTEGSAPGPHPVNVFCMSGEATARHFLNGAAAVFAGHRNIGNWAWELTDWPNAWIPFFDLLDEVWVPSHFTQEAMALKAAVPVVHMPPAVDAAMARPHTRAEFGLPDNRLIVLAAFDWSQTPERMNPEGAIAAFQMAFPDPAAPASLAIKITGAPAADPRLQALISTAAGDSRIGIVNTSFDRETHLGLISVADIFVSLHRTEAYGRTIAEAMLLGRPVITTGWSGNTDFCTVETAALVSARVVKVPEQAYPTAGAHVWGDPDVTQAADLLRRLAIDPGVRARLGEAGRNRARQWADPQHIGLRYAARLETLRRRWVRAG